MMVDQPVQALRLMRDCRIMPELIKEDLDLSMMAALAGLQRRLGSKNLEARLAMMVQDIGQLEKYLVLSTQQKRNVEQLLKAVRSPTTIKERLYYFGRETGSQSLLMLIAQMDAVINDEELDIMRNWEIPVFPIDGSDLKKIGVSEGPQMGSILKSVEEWWVELFILII